MKLKNSYEIVEFDNEIIAVPIGGNAYSDNNVIIKLNESASYIFHLLENDILEDEIIASIKRLYTTGGNNIASDVHDCIDELRKRGLLVE